MLQDSQTQLICVQFKCVVLMIWSKDVIFFGSTVNFSDRMVHVCLIACKVKLIHTMAFTENNHKDIQWSNSQRLQKLIYLHLSTDCFNGPVQHFRTLQTNCYTNLLQVSYHVACRETQRCWVRWRMRWCLQSSLKSTQEKHIGDKVSNNMI